jgi:hypothetical protein
VVEGRLSVCAELAMAWLSRWLPLVAALDRAAWPLAGDGALLAVFEWLAGMGSWRGAEWQRARAAEGRDERLRPGPVAG